MNDNTTQTSAQDTGQKTPNLVGLVNAMAALSDDEAAIVWAAARGTNPPQTDPTPSTTEDTTAPDNSFPTNWSV